MVIKQSKRCLSLAMAFLMVVGLSFNIVPATSAADTKIVYDYSVSVPQNTANQKLGDPASSYSRSTFLRVFDSNFTLETIELDITRPAGTSGQPSITVYVYAKDADTMKPIGDALSTGVVSSADVPTNDNPTSMSVDMIDALLVPGDYVVIAECGPIEEAGDRYNWYCSGDNSANIAADNYSSIYNSANGADWVGNPVKGYEGFRCGMKAIGFISDGSATIDPDDEAILIDFGFEEISGSGSGLGHTGEPMRGQSFTSLVTGKLDAVELFLFARLDPENEPQLQDLVVTVYATKANGEPIPGTSGEGLGRITVAKEQLNINTTLTSLIDLSSLNIDLVKGIRYMIALTTPTLAPDGGVGVHYRWPGVAGAKPNEYHFKLNPDGTVVANESSGLNSRWMKVYAGGETAADHSTNVEGPGRPVGAAGSYDKIHQAFDLSLMSKDAVVSSVSVLLFKNEYPTGTGAFPDAIVGIYALDENNLPTGDALAEKTVAASDIISGVATRVAFNAPITLVPGKYSVVIGTSKAGVRYVDYMYSWARKDGVAEAISGRYFDNLWRNDTAGNLYWLVVNEYVEPQTTTVLDMTEGITATSGSGLGVGTADNEVWRWQSFTATVSGTLDKVDVWVNRRESAEYHQLSDLVAELYRTASDGTYFLPTGDPLARVVIPRGELTFNGNVGHEVALHFNYAGIEQGARYAVALTQSELAPNGGSTGGEHYRWPSKGNIASPEEFGGKRNPAGTWVFENFLFYLKVTMTGKTTIEPRPTKLTVTPSSANLQVGKTFVSAVTVTDQFGNEIQNPKLEWSSNNPGVADVDENGLITAYSAGSARISVLCGLLERYITVQVNPVGSPDKIYGEPTVALALGETKTLHYVMMDDFKGTLDEVTPLLSYTLDNGTVASLDGANIQALAVGEALLTVQYEDFVKYVCVKVYDPNDTTLVTPTPGMVITQSVTFKPGVYDIGTSSIVIQGNDIVIDGNGAVLVNGDKTGPNCTGVGIKSDGYDNVTLRNISVKGYNTGVIIDNAENWTIEFCNFSDNYTDPDYGWGDGPDPLRGGLLVRYFNNGIIRYSNANRVWNNLQLRNSDSNKIYYNDFGDSSNVAIKMWSSSFNEICDNIFNWGLRAKPTDAHANDSTSSLIEGFSNYNYIARNDFSHGGDGIFIRPLYGTTPTGNYFLENDTSYAWNNAIESWASGNVYVGNDASYSSYGIWLGGSDFTYIINNKAQHNGTINARNAHEFGNAGICVIYGSSSHTLAMGNDARYNTGSAIGFEYNDTYPAYHWLVQNNLLSNTNKSGQAHGYGLQINRTEWVDIMSNDMTQNEAGKMNLYSAKKAFVTGENTALSTLGMPKASVAITGAHSYEQADIYWDKIPQAIKDDEFGYVHITYVSAKVGQAITFDASGSVDPQGLPLTYRWEMGDGAVEYGDTVIQSYDKPGRYKVGLTLSNGELGDIRGFVVNILPEGEEIGTEDGAADWSVSANLTVSDYSARTVDGGNALRFDQVTGRSNVAKYPAAGTLAQDFSAYDVLSLNLFSEGERTQDVTGVPIIRLCKDENNYIRYTAALPFISSISMPDNMSRYSFTYAEVDLRITNDYFTRAVVGQVDLSEINYIEIQFGANAGPFYLLVDGLKLMKASEIEGLSVAPNVARDVAAIYSGALADSNPDEVLGDKDFSNPDVLPMYVSTPDEDAWFGADFSEARYIDKVSVYFDYTQAIAKPLSFEIQVLVDDEWVSVSNPVYASSTVKMGLNSVRFDTVNASGVRAVMTVPAGKSIALYGFLAFCEANFIGNSQGVSYPARSISTSLSALPNLLQVGTIVNRKNMSNPTYPLTDLVVGLFNTEGDHAVGAPLASVVVANADVLTGGAETVVELPYAGLIPGTRYAIGITQSDWKGDGGNQDHWLWPSSTALATEHGGKITDWNSGSSYREGVGNFYLNIYTDNGTISLPNIGKSGGFGVGHSGEPGRYQTFTVPSLPDYQMVDGTIADGNGWTTEGSALDVHTVTLDMGELRDVKQINAFFSTDANLTAPQSIAIEGWNGTEWIDVGTFAVNSNALSLGMNIDGIVSQIRLTITEHEGTASGLRELEALGIAAEEAPDLTVWVTTPTLVETLKARLAIKVEGTLTGTAYLSVNGELTNATEVSNGAAMMTIDAAPVAGSDVKVVVIDGTATGQCNITIAAYNPAELWSPSLNPDNFGKLLITFSEQIAPKNNGAYGVTINATSYACVQEGDNALLVDVEYSSINEGAVIVVKGVKYPILFPSYSFTFTLSK